MFAQSKLIRLSGATGATGATGAALGGSLILLSFLFSGCADSVWWGGESNLGATETGVVAGAAIGAGLGAFIGSTAGGAGEGLVIGALAGGVTGGLVGREIELEKGVKVERTESFRQRDEMIREQRKEQNQIRRNSSDVAQDSFAAPASRSHYAQERSTQGRAQLGREFDFKGNSSSGKVNFRSEGVRYGKKSYLNPPSRPNSAAKPYDGYGSESFRRETVVARNSGAVSAQRFPEPRLKTNTDTFEATSPVTRSQSEARKEFRALASEAPSADVKSELAPVVSKREELPPAKSMVTAPEKPTEVAAVAQPSTEQCVDAQEEASRAQTASSDADKLFYLTRAIRLCPQNSDYHTQVGKVYAKIGRRQDAEFEFRQALDLDADNSEAAAFLGKKKTESTQGNAAAPEETAALDTDEGGELPEGEL